MSVSGSNGFAYDRLCKVAEARGWKVGLEVADLPGRLTRMWVRDKADAELTVAPIPPGGRLNDVADLLLDDLQVA